jgi:hypothetical protein
MPSFLPFPSASSATSAVLLPRGPHVDSPVHIEQNIANQSLRYKELVAGIPHGPRLTSTPRDATDSRTGTSATPPRRKFFPAPPARRTPLVLSPRLAHLPANRRPLAPREAIDAPCAGAPAHGTPFATRGASRLRWSRGRSDITGEWPHRLLSPARSAAVGPHRGSAWRPLWAQ